MKIKRNSLVWGVMEIELTPEEVRQAYCEHQRLCDTEDVLNELDGYTVDEFIEEFGNTKAFAEENAEKIALLKRTMLDKTGEECMDYTRKAIRRFCSDENNG